MCNTSSQLDDKDTLSLNKVHLEKPILEIFILVLMVHGIESHGKNLLSWEILIRSITTQIIILVLINMVLRKEYDYDFGKLMDGLNLQILMVGVSGILDIG